jgi:hypothetical protein
MVALTAWYDPDEDEPITVNSRDDLEALLDRAIADSTDAAVPPLIQLSRRDPEGWAILQVGLNDQRGIITHTDGSGGAISSNGDSDGQNVNYDYMGHLRDVPANAEIPIQLVRKAAHEYLDSAGKRPACVNWQEVPAR